MRRMNLGNFWRPLMVTAGLFVGAASIGCEKAPSDPAAPEAETAEPTTGREASESSSAAAPRENITLKVVDAEGYQKVLDKHRGKVVFVDFWATWCGPCMENFPHTVHIHRAFPQDQVAVISVSLDDPENKDAALEFLQKEEARFDNLLSEYGAGVESFEKFNIDGAIPHYKVYDRSGKEVNSITTGPDVKITLELLEGEVRKVVEAGA